MASILSRPQCDKQNEIIHTTLHLASSWVWIRFSIYGRARYPPMKEDVTYVTSSVIGWDLAQPYIENGPRDSTHEEEVTSFTAYYIPNMWYEYTMRVACNLQGPLLLTWINLNPNMDK